MRLTPYLPAIFMSLLSICLSSPVNAQTSDNPGSYMNAISKARGDMDAKYMAYVSAVAHGRRARKVEKLRQEVLDNIQQSRYNTTDLSPYKGDNSLRQGSIDYIQMCYIVFSEDYKKIVNMEELAEQSVDEMQAYLLLQDKVNDRLNEAFANLEKINNDFAAKYHVNLIKESTPLGDKIETAGKLTTYVNKVYLCFFKCNWEDGQVTKALNDKKVDAVEQSRNALISYADEGLHILDTLKPFEGDPSLANACKAALKFYKRNAGNDIPKLTDYYLKEDDFEKLKKSFNDKSASDRTKADVDAYNKAVKDINQAVASFNQVNSRVNNERRQVVDDWNNEDKHFNDDHMPHYR